MIDLITSFIWFGLRCLLGSMIMGLSALWYYQDKLMYFPDIRGPRQLSKNEPNMRSPREWNLPFSENFITTTDDVLLHSWLILQHNSISCPTIVYLHGNAGNIGYRLPNAHDLYRKTQSNILMVEYRGYGNSEGIPTERGLSLDGEAALEWLQHQTGVINPASIFIFGRSLGGAVALKLSHRNPDLICGTIVENTFTTIDEMVVVLGSRMGVTYVNALRVFCAFFLSNHWNNEYFITQITTPVLFLSGAKDELVPPDHMKRLYDLCCSPSRRLHSYPNGGHNDTFVVGGDKYYSDIRQFIDTHRFQST